MAIDFDGIHTLGFRIAPLASGMGGAGTRHFILTLDGRTVRSGDTAFHPASPETVTIGANRIAAGTCDAVFERAVLRLTFPPDDTP